MATLDKKICSESANDWFEKGKSLTDNFIIHEGTYVFRAGIWEAIQLYRGIRCFKKTLKLDPSAWQAMLFIGKSYQSLAKYDLSLVWVKKAYNINNSSALAREIALCYGRLGDVQSGINYTCQAAELTPNDKGLRFNLGVLYLLAGQFSSAKSEIKRVLLMDNKNTIAKRLLVIISQIESGDVSQPVSEKELIGLIDQRSTIF